MKLQLQLQLKVRTASLAHRLLDEFDDFGLGGEASTSFLGDLSIVEPYGELTSAAWFQIGLEIELVFDQRRHTGGARLVVSNHAVADLDSHSFHSSTVPKRSRGSKGFQRVWFTRSGAFRPDLNEKRELPGA